MPPAIINAAYVPMQNSITIPAGILAGSFFNPNVPMYINFGSLGLVIGHEFTHGFDDQGRQYDSKGNLINWWSQEILDKFQSKAKCFIDQYGSIVEPKTGLKVRLILCDPILQFFLAAEWAEYHRREHRWQRRTERSLFGVERLYQRERGSTKIATTDAVQPGTAVLCFLCSNVV